MDKKIPAASNRSKNFLEKEKRRGKKSLIHILIGINV